MFNKPIKSIENFNMHIRYMDTIHIIMRTYNLPLALSNTFLQSEINICIILGQIGPKLPICPESTFLGDIQLMLLLSTYFALSYCKVFKKSLQQILICKIACVWDKSNKNCPFAP